MKIWHLCWTTFGNKIRYWKKWPSRLRVKTEVTLTIHFLIDTYLELWYNLKRLYKILQAWFVSQYIYLLEGGLHIYVYLVAFERWLIHVIYWHIDASMLYCNYCNSMSTWTARICVRINWLLYTHSNVHCCKPFSPGWCIWYMRFIRIPLSNSMFTNFVLLAYEYHSIVTAIVIIDISIFIVLKNGTPKSMDK